MNTSRPRLRLPSPALIISCLALFAALGGGAYAATSLSHTTLQWHNATLTGGWASYKDDYAPPGYARDSNGVVHLRGAMKNGGQTAAFTLPTGYRPAHFMGMLIDTDAGTPGKLSIYPTGQVFITGGDASVFSDIDGVSFAAGE
jgi:hypothetical protein